MVKRICPTCNQEYEVNTGIHNWKNLFRKPTVEDLITLFIIVFVIISYFTYQADMRSLKEYYESGYHCIDNYKINEVITSQDNFILPLNLQDTDLKDGTG
jgi:hypothetical protein